MLAKKYKALKPKVLKEIATNETVFVTEATKKTK
jgi:hypothetical protein